MSGSVTLTFPADSAALTAVLAVLATLGVPAPAAGASVPVPIPAAPPAPAAGETVAPPPAGSFMDTTGLAVIDAAGAALIADPRNASAAYLAALRLMASKPDLSEDELLAVVGAATLAGNKAATTKRVQGALGGKLGAVLYRIENKKVVLANATRQALARHFGFIM
jgi:hypothetical protein